jgi:stearoyl-CoA desaturase (Delta-9 desaturase)
MAGTVRTWLQKVILWFDTEGHEVPGGGDGAPKHVDLPRVLPFIAVHLVCLGVIWVGWSPVAVGVALLGYAVRMFAITGFYHRYFSHRTFRTSRFWQFFFAVIGNSSTQRGPLWWAAHHRKHHRHSDTEADPHSPDQHGFLWSHMLWLTSPQNFATDINEVRDLAKFRELRFLNRFDTLVPVAYAAGTVVLGMLLEKYVPSLGTTGPQMLIWGYFISTVALFHGTCTINSLAHRIGTRRYETGEASRNNLLLALITFGEGWHNNHHYCPGATRQGFFWWEVDLTYYVLKVLSWIGIVQDLHPVPARAYGSSGMVGRSSTDEPDPAGRFGSVPKQAEMPDVPAGGTR